MFALVEGSIITSKVGPYAVELATADEDVSDLAGMISISLAWSCNVEYQF